jgi:uncharacterized protein YggE
MLNAKTQQQIAGILTVLFTILSVYVLVLTVGAVKKVAQIGKPEPIAWTISMRGVGTVNVEPNLSVISFGIRTENKSSEVAQSENANSVNALLAELRGMGIPEADLKTMNYSMQENRVWNPSNNELEMRGWIVYQNLEVKIRNTELVPKVLSLAGRSNVTDVSGPNFQVDEREEYLKVAREEAIKDATNRAEELSRQLGVRLGRVVSFDEWEDQYYQPYYMERSAMGDGIMPEVASGQNEVKINVTITYEVK